MQRELSPKVTEGLFSLPFRNYNPSASHSLGTSLYTREAVRQRHGCTLPPVEREEQAPPYVVGEPT